ncbi:unnamed protein product, partial [Mesorhabditis belari]|uniref:Uncharacterized protein n=1 Tax=Mesorhabditis belari TaxID=2138241 RepID=A0AAF3EY33_9BILA
MSPASPNEKNEQEVNEAGTSQTAPPDTAKIIQAFSTISTPSSPLLLPQLQPIALPARRQTLRMDANQIKMRFLKRRALKPYNRTPLPSISCLLPVRENYTPPQETISPLGLDACGLVPPDAWCCDEFYDWTAVYVPSFCNWPQQSQEPGSQPYWTQSQQIPTQPTNSQITAPTSCYHQSKSPNQSMTLHASVNFGQAV